MSTPKKRRRSRGQAMVEYSFINFVLIMVLCLASTARVLPSVHNTLGQNNTNKSLIELFLESYQIYYDSYYFVLNLPFP
jgi:hypothetical protein